jgi:hypothetical protein
MPSRDYMKRSMGVEQPVRSGSVVLMSDRPYQHHSESELHQMLNSIRPFLKGKVKEKNEMPIDWDDYPSLVAHIESMENTIHQINLEFAARREERRQQAEVQATSAAAAAQPMTAPPPGWYHDPANPKRIVRWDGQQWAEDLWIAG